MSDLACADCTKRFETGAPSAPLQCRALPPVQGPGFMAVFPHVKPTDFCHLYFQADAEAVKAARAAAEQAARFDALVSATQERASPPRTDDPDATDPGGEEPKRSRARRARPAAADVPKLDL